MRQYFSGERYLQKLRRKYQLRGVKLEDMKFQNGKALVIDSDMVPLIV